MVRKSDGVLVDCKYPAITEYVKFVLGSNYAFEELDDTHIFINVPPSEASLCQNFLEEKIEEFQLANSYVTEREDERDN